MRPQRFTLCDGGGGRGGDGGGGGGDGGSSDSGGGSGGVAGGRGISWIILGLKIARFCRFPKRRNGRTYGRTDPLIEMRGRI